ASRRGLSVLDARGCKRLTSKQLKVTWRIYLPRVSDFWKTPRQMHTAKRTGKLLTNPYFELSMICCAFLIADSSGALSFFRMSIAFCAEAMASFLLPSFNWICAFL